MTYSTDLRAKTLAYLKTHTYVAIVSTFQVSVATLQRWEKSLEETGALKDTAAFTLTNVA